MLQAFVIVRRKGLGALQMVGALLAWIGARAGGAPRLADLAARFGQALQRHRRVVQALQWTVVLAYAVLVVVPALRPPPPQQAHLWNDLTLFAQFAFWGLWWPFVILSVLLLGRGWCGLLCPEGTLTEWASRHGLGRSIPRWLRWSGWPPLAFVFTTVWGQLVSVYEYPRATLLILGGSTLLALAVGLVWGLGTRVWCRHLCPVSGVFALLARVAPLHYRADAQAWRAYRGPLQRVQCAPLLDLRHLDAGADCHACGRCAGHRGAIALAVRRPGLEIVQPPARPAQAQPVAAAWLLLAGVMGVALGAFLWSSSPLVIAARQAAVGWLLDHDATWALQDNAPWWLLTHEPAAHDVFLWLDGALIVASIAAVAALMGGAGWLACRGAAALLAPLRLHWSRLALALVPLGAAGLFIGLTLTTLTQLRAEGIVWPAVGALRALLLGGATAWSLALAWQLGRGAAAWRRLGACMLVALPALLTDGAWAWHFLRG